MNIKVIWFGWILTFPIIQLESTLLQLTKHCSKFFSSEVECYLLKMVTKLNGIIKIENPNHLSEHDGNFWKFKAQLVRLHFWGFMSLFYKWNVRCRVTHVCFSLCIDFFVRFRYHWIQLYLQISVLMKGVNLFGIKWEKLLRKGFPKSERMKKDFFKHLTYNWMEQIKQFYWKSGNS